MKAQQHVQRRQVKVLLPVRLVIDKRQQNRQVAAMISRVSAKSKSRNWQPGLEKRNCRKSGTKTLLKRRLNLGSISSIDLGGLRAERPGITISSCNVTFTLLGDSSKMPIQPNCERPVARNHTSAFSEQAERGVAPTCQDSPSKLIAIPCPVAYAIPMLSNSDFRSGKSTERLGGEA